MLLLLVRAGRFWGTFQCSLLAVVRLSHLLPLDRSDAGILLHRCLHRSNGPHRHEARPVQVAAQPLQGARGCQNSQHGDPFVSPHLSEVCCRCWRRCWRRRLEIMTLCGCPLCASCAGQDGGGRPLSPGATYPSGRQAAGPLVLRVGLAGALLSPQASGPFCALASLLVVQYLFVTPANASLAHPESDSCCARTWHHLVRCSSVLPCYVFCSTTRSGRRIRKRCSASSLSLSARL